MLHEMWINELCGILFRYPSMLHEICGAMDYIIYFLGIHASRDVWINGLRDSE